MPRSRRPGDRVTQQNAARAKESAATATALHAQEGDISALAGDLLRSMGGNGGTDTAGRPAETRPGGRRKYDPVSVAATAARNRSRLPQTAAAGAAV